MEHLIHFIKDLKQTGAVAPSSKFLVRDLVARLKKNISSRKCPPLNILEIGPGTGPLTKEILNLIRPKDHLDIVEIHDHFFKTIKEKYQRENVTVHHRDILNFEPSLLYDFIFSSLPYEVMPEQLIRDIWKKKLTLCSRNAYICYFKYFSFRQFKCDFEKELVKRFQQNKKVVLLNFPPARIFTLEISEAHPKPLQIVNNVA